MRYPVNYIGITQGFSNNHKGLDLGWHTHNCPVFSVADGVVIYSKFQSTGGYVIHIRHDNGLVSEYGHLQQGSIKVKVNDRVSLGQQIANMGATGKVSGEHLHIGLYKGNSINYNINNWVNPLDYLEVYEGQEVAEGTLKTYGNKIKFHKDEPKHDIYTLLADMYLRKGAGTNFDIVKVGETTQAMRSALTSTDPNAKAVVKKGTNVTALEVIENENGTWLKNYSGYICIKNADGEYCKRID